MLKLLFAKPIRNDTCMTELLGVALGRGHHEKTYLSNLTESLSFFRGIRTEDSQKLQISY